jgi:hypothetical protein
VCFRRVTSSACDDTFSLNAVDAEAAPGNDVVEAQVMTKKMLRELAARRGVSYTELARQAEASGVELPDE